MIIDKINLLNRTVMESLSKDNEIDIIKAFTDLGVDILEADFGFVWLNPKLSQEWKLVYKTKNLPFTPNKPRNKGRNYRVLKSGKIDFVKNLKNTKEAQRASSYMKSLVIIPIHCYEKIYGTIVLCFKEKENFFREKRILSVLFGNSMAHALTIYRFELSKNTERLLTEEKMKVESIADATHELRTPLAIIKGNVDLANPGKGKKLKPFKNILKDIDLETRHLSNIISDLALITSKNKSLKDAISTDRVNIRQLIKEVIERCSSLAHKKNISITAKNIRAVKVAGDKMYLEKMLTNLIKNSINYGNQNGHTRISTMASKGFVAIHITDDGVGISKGDLPHIFERFYRGDKSHSSEGTGLGLPIVKWIAETHGGSVSVKSKLNKGTTFSILLPMKAK